MADKVIYAMYDDDDVLKDGAKKLVSKGVKVSEVFSPFPIHGIDPIIGLKNTRLGIMAFIYGLFGLTLATLGLRYFMVVDWPMNIGGKPNFTFYHNMPAFIPIMFECTVMFAAHLMSITYLIRNGLYPGGISDSPDSRTTDDKFLMEIEVEGDVATIKSMLTKTGATEINEKDA